MRLEDCHTSIKQRLAALQELFDEHDRNQQQFKSDSASMNDD
jgi:hypothetical protein